MAFSKKEMLNTQVNTFYAMLTKIAVIRTCFARSADKAICIKVTQVVKATYTSKSS